MQGLSNLAKRKGKIDSWEKTHLRRGLRDLEEKRFRIDQLKNELNKLNSNYSSSSSKLSELSNGSSSKEGIKSLQKDLKDTKNQITRLESELISINTSKTRLSTLVEAETKKLNELDQKIILGPEAKVLLDPLEESIKKIDKELQESTNKVNELIVNVQKKEREKEKVEQSIKGFKRDIERDQMSKKLLIKQINKIVSDGSTTTEDECMEEIAKIVEDCKVSSEEIDSIRKNFRPLTDDIRSKNIDIKIEVKKQVESRSKEFIKLQENFLLKEKNVDSLRSQINSIENNILESKNHLSVEQEKLDKLKQFLQDEHQHLTSKFNRRSLTLSNQLKSFQSIHSDKLLEKQTLSTYIDSLELELTDTNLLSQEDLIGLEMQSSKEKIHLSNLGKIEFEMKEELAAQVEIENDLEVTLSLISSNSSKRNKELWKEKGKNDAEKVKELEKMLEIRMLKKERNRSRITASSNRYISSPSNSTVSSSSTTTLSLIIPKLLATTKELNKELSMLREENMNLVLQLAGVDI